MIRRLSLGIAALAAALVGAAASAQPGPAAPPSAPLYQVEVLVFAYRDFDKGEERFVQQRRTVRGDEARRPVPVFDESTLDALGGSTAPSGQGATPPPGADAPPPGQPGAPLGATEQPLSEAEILGFRILRPEELQLTAEYRKIERLPAYVALAHGGWVQSALPEGRSQSFDLALLGVMNPVGSVRVYLSRFLHIRVDLSYQERLAGAAGATPARGDLAELDIAPRYDLVTERQTRSGELQYFDHPAFGVLVKVTPVPAGATGPGPGRGPRPAA
jgi:hypothetical protein